MKKPGICLIILLLISACHSGEKGPAANSTEKTPTEQTTQAEPSGNDTFTNLLPSVVNIDTYDNGRILESGSGFFVNENLVVSRASFFASANQAEITPYNEENKYKVSGYLAVDRINDLILLQVENIRRPPVKLCDSLVSPNQKSLYLTKPHGQTIPLHKGSVLAVATLQGSKVYQVSNKFPKISEGGPLFLSGGNCIGLCFSTVSDYEKQYFATPSTFIQELLKNKSATPKSLADLMNNTNSTISAANSKIKGLTIETDMGDIQIRLFNQTPDYRDNFIKLVREHYYDNLLIHRVIRGFGIQSGAADTRSAGKDDVVGWKGPGYTMPAHVVPGLFHKRGVIGSPRKPDTENMRRRADGSQFYIVSGRTYTDEELNQIEKENNIHFTPEQRQVYKTIGGAPHLDGSYTIFGEVTSGMDVVDRISTVEVGREFRPKEDIRVKRIRIIE